MKFLTLCNTYHNTLQHTETYCNTLQQVILSGFVIKKFLGGWTLLIK